MDDCYYLVKIIDFYRHEVSKEIVIDLQNKELSVLHYKGASVYKSMGMCLSVQDVDMIKSYVHIDDFEPFRDREQSMSDVGFMGYLDDGLTREFVALSDDGNPMLRISMNYSYNKMHRWPTYKLYDFIREEFLRQDNKREKIYYINGKKVRQF